MAAEEARARLRDLCRRLLRACGRALSVGRLCAALLEPWAPMASNALPAKVRSVLRPAVPVKRQQAGHPCNNLTLTHSHCRIGACLAYDEWVREQHFL